MCLVAFLLKKLDRLFKRAFPGVHLDPGHVARVAQQSVLQLPQPHARILGEIQDGSFARELVEEFDAGKPNFLKRREEEHNEQIEQVGARLRPLMSWLDEDE